MATYTILKNMLGGNPQEITNRTKTKEAYCILTSSGEVVYDLKNGDTRYEDIEISLSYGEVPAYGGSMYPSLSYSASKHDLGFSGNRYNESTVTTGATVTYTIVGGSPDISGATLSSNGVVGNVPSRGATKDDNKRNVMTVSVRVEFPDGTYDTKDFTVKQAANGIVANSEWYGAPTFEASVTDIPPAGGTKTEGTITSRSQNKYAKLASGYDYVVQTITTGGTASWSGSVSGDNLGTTETSRTKKGTLKCTLTMNSVKSAEKTVDVYQEANAVVTETTSTSYRPSTSQLLVVSGKDGSVRSNGDVYAGAGEYYIKYNIERNQTGKKRTWRSGATDYVGGTWSQHTTFSSSSSLNQYSDNKTLEVATRGTTVGNRKSVGFLKTKYSTYNLDATFEVFQEANAVTQTDKVVNATSLTVHSDIAATGGSTYAGVAFGITARNRYTSGSYGTGYTISNFDVSLLSFSYRLASTSVFSIDSSTGTITAGANNTQNERSTTVYGKVCYDGTWSNEVSGTVKQLKKEVIKVITGTDDTFKWCYYPTIDSGTYTVVKGVAGSQGATVSYYKVTIPTGCAATITHDESVGGGYGNMVISISSGSSQNCTVKTYSDSNFSTLTATNIKTFSDVLGTYFVHYIGKSAPTEPILSIEKQ